MRTFHSTVHCLAQLAVPDRYQYFDRFQREVGWLERNFADTGWKQLRRNYDDRGQLLWETNVFSNLDVPGTLEYTYYDGYDNLGARRVCANRRQTTHMPRLTFPTTGK